LLSQIQIQHLSLCPSVCFSTLSLPLIYNRFNQSPVTFDLNFLFLIAQIRRSVPVILVFLWRKEWISAWNVLARNFWVGFRTPQQWCRLMISLILFSLAINTKNPKGVFLSLIWMNLDLNIHVFISFFFNVFCLFMWIWLKDWGSDDGKENVVREW
jgi:hypothetical protein